MTIISSPQYRGISGSIITEQDLHILERCNRDGLTSLERIVGVDRKGNPVQEVHKQAENDLRAAGDIWSEHILENAKAYILTFIYIVGTVTSGYPLISGLAKAFGLTGTEGKFYVIRFLDALIYFWLPQINITIVRLCIFCDCFGLSSPALLLHNHPIYRSFDCVKDVTCAIAWWDELWLLATHVLGLLSQRRRFSAKYLRAATALQG